MKIEQYPDFLRGMSEHIDKFLQRKIVIYGLGFYTEECIRCFPQLEIKGLLDGFREEGELYGKRILSCREVLKEEADCILVAARPASVRVIYKRIEAFCRTNHIDVYDIYGNDLHDRERSNRVRTPILCERGELRSLIWEADVVCFDVFDTLLVREVPEPQDIFRWMEQYGEPRIDGFAKLRGGAEHEIPGHEPASLQDIYQVIERRTSLTSEERRRLIISEIETEKKFLRVRTEVKRLYDWTAEQGKKIYLVSDMYLSTNVMDEILRYHGINKHAGLIISCEHGKNKRQGLFSVVKNLEKKAKILHIGDNRQADAEAAKRQGLDSFWIPSVNEFMENSAFEGLVREEAFLPAGIQTKKLAFRLFQNPFSRYTPDGKVKVDSPYDLGYAFFAPLITVFAMWMFRKWKENETDCVLFGARDGYLFHRLYGIYLDMYPEERKIKNIYFYISRKASMLANIEEAAQVKELAEMNYTGPPERMLQDRFGLDGTQISPYLGQEPDSYVSEHLDLILRKSAKIRENYLRYIETLDIGDRKNIAFVDFASTGTCQMYLEELWNRKVQGYYFARLYDDKPDKKKLMIRSFIKDTEISQVPEGLSSLFPLLESVISSREPMLGGFYEDGSPYFSEEYRSAGQLRALEEVQNGIADYFKEWLRLGIWADVELAENAAAILQKVTGKDTKWPTEMCDWKETDEFYGREALLADLYS